VDLFFPIECREGLVPHYLSMIPVLNFDQLTMCARNQGFTDYQQELPTYIYVILVSGSWVVLVIGVTVLILHALFAGAKQWMGRRSMHDRGNDAEGALPLSAKTQRRFHSADSRINDIILPRNSVVSLLLTLNQYQKQSGKSMCIFLSSFTI